MKASNSENCRVLRLSQAFDASMKGIKNEPNLPNHDPTNYLKDRYCSGEQSPDSSVSLKKMLGSILKEAESRFLSVLTRQASKK